MKNVKIVLSGNAGSGKSTIGKMLAEKLAVEFLSVGNICRARALELGMDINQFQEYLKKDSEFDKAMDLYITEYARSRNNYILDYRLGFHFLPESFKVLLKVSDDTALKRMGTRARSDEDFSKGTLEGKLKVIRTRNELMRTRFIDVYGADFSDERNYDLVIDTDYAFPEEIIKTIEAEIKL